jgi:hypothetical protein
LIRRGVRRDAVSGIGGKANAVIENLDGMFADQIGHRRLVGSADRYPVSWHRAGPYPGRLLQVAPRLRARQGPGSARRANQSPSNCGVSSTACKNISLTPSGKSVALSRASRAERGALANVINAARDAVDAEAPNDERRRSRTAKSCGPDAPVLASSLWIRSQATVARKPVTGESAL